MIFVTLGTHQPFDRLIRIVDGWSQNSGAEVFGQIPDPGVGGYRPTNFRWVTHLPPADYRARFEAAPFAIAHAGMGSIITALSIGKPIVIFPRLAKLSEQRNDHQTATVERFKNKPGVYAATEEAELIATLDRLFDTADRERGPVISPFAEPRLTNALRAAILSAPARGA